MSTLTNAAGRLHALIETGLKFPANMVIKDAWTKILNTDPKDTSQLLVHLSAALQLPSQAEAEVRQLKMVNVDHVLVWVPPVQRAFSALNLEEHWEKFRIHFEKNGAALHTLQIAA